MTENFKKLKEYLDKKNLYNYAASLMYWDMATTMPDGGFPLNSDASTFFSTESFKMGTSKELENLIDELLVPEIFETLEPYEKFSVKRMKKDFVESSRVPVDFYSEMVRVTKKSEKAWEKAKQNSDFSMFAPHLKKMIDYTVRYYQYIRPGKDPYEEMLSDHEEGMDSATIDRLFEELKAELVPLVKKILAAKQPDDSKFRVKYDTDCERRVQKELLSYIGFNWENGTVGETEHPFTMGFSMKDVRVTNHFNEDNAIDPMFSAIHEGGHAIFDQNVNPEFENTPAAECDNMGIHESQSRFYENILGRNKNFWAPIYSKIQELQPEFKNISLDEYYHEINHVRNSLIRIEADEVTYCLHIILRYEMEKAIFRDGVDVSELPALWNAKMREYLDIEPDCDATGILQDMHWSDGSFGYFPSYLLGSIYDGMYLDKITEELGDVNTILREGRILEITKWLNEKIHQYGNMRLPKEVIENVCGKPVSAEPLCRYFREKYTELYNL